MYDGLEGVLFLSAGGGRRALHCILGQIQADLAGREFLHIQTGSEQE